MEDEINLRDYIEVLKKRWKTIASFAFVLGLLSLIISFISTPVYKAETTILVRQSGGGGGFSQYSGLASFFGFDAGYGGRTLYELIELMESRAVATKVLKDLSLKERAKGWNNPELSEQRLVKWVQNIINVEKPETNLLTISVEFTDPILVAEITNGFLDAVSHYWNKLNYSEARKKREYIEKQLPGVETDLKNAEQKFKKFTLLSPRGGNSIAGYQSGGIEINRLAREFEIQNAVYTMLRKEYESVKLEEAKEIPPFSIVDKPDIPERPIRPRKKLNTLMGVTLGMFIGGFVAFFREYWEKSA